MAKKRKAKKRTVKKRTIKTVQPNRASAAHTLGLAGAVITLVAGILWAIATILQLSINSLSWVQVTDFGLINILSGVIMIIAMTSFKNNMRKAAWLLLVFSILALIFPPAGFVVGPILSLVGGIILLMKK
ncbi:MAG: hypothetical protein ABH817_01380 [archaeon]